VERIGRERTVRRILRAGVPSSHRRTARTLSRFVLTWAAVLALALVVTQRTAAVDADDYRIDVLASRVAQLSADDQALAAQDHTLASAAHLAAVAQSHGLVMPPTVELLPIGGGAGASSRAAKRAGRQPSRGGAWADLTRALWRMLHGG
jgi:hypothetical protein